MSFALCTHPKRELVKASFERLKPSFHRFFSEERNFTDLLYTDCSRWKFFFFQNNLMRSFSYIFIFEKQHQHTYCCKKMSQMSKIMKNRVSLYFSCSLRASIRNQHAALFLPSCGECFWKIYKPYHSISSTWRTYKIKFSLIWVPKEFFFLQDIACLFLTGNINLIFLFA